MRAAGMLAAAIAWILLLASPAQEAAVEPPPSQWDGHLLELEQQAIESAFLKQIELLYGNWMKDFSDEKAVRRVVIGARNARAAYVRAMTQIELRKH